MGATGIYTTASFKDVLKQEIYGSGFELIDSHYVKQQPLNGELEEGHFYLALKKLDGKVFGCIITMVRITRNGREEVIYKWMDEAVEPYYYDCPEHILKKLTPLSEFDYVGHAAEWRSKQKCNQNNQMHLFTS